MTSSLYRRWRACIRVVQALVLSCVMSLVLPLTAHALEVKDDLGNTIQFARSPQRIVSLLPSLTETVCALGACQRLVGVDMNSNFPRSVDALVHLGSGLTPNVEAIVALHPDVVLIAQSSQARDRLQALGLKVLTLEPHNHADVQRVISALGILLQLPDANQFWQRIDQGMSEVARSLPASVLQERVYFEVNRAPYAASEASFIGETLQRLRVRNVVPASLGAFPKLNPEFVVRANPSIIMVGDSDPDDLVSRPGWQRIHAVREKRICRFSAEEADTLVRPGPRMVEGARTMAACLKKFARDTP